MIKIKKIMKSQQRNDEKKDQNELKVNNKELKMNKNVQILRIIYHKFK